VRPGLLWFLLMAAAVPIAPPPPRAPEPDPFRRPDPEPEPTPGELAELPPELAATMKIPAAVSGQPPTERELRAAAKRARRAERDRLLRR
jgi:hypothetical protein